MSAKAVEAGKKLIVSIDKEMQQPRLAESVRESAEDHAQAKPEMPAGKLR